MTKYQKQVTKLRKLQSNGTIQHISIQTKQGSMHTIEILAHLPTMPHVHIEVTTRDLSQGLKSIRKMIKSIQPKEI